MNIVTRKVAKIRGEPTYFTGTPCKNGHVAYRYVASGACSECVKSANGRRVDPLSEERRAAKMRLVRINLRCFAGDRATLALAVHAAAVMRFPVLTEADVDPHLLPSDRSGDTALHAFHCHELDIPMLRRIACDLIDAKSASGAAARAKALAQAANALPADTTPPESYR